MTQPDKSASDPWELLGSVRTAEGFGFDVYRNQDTHMFFARRHVPGGVAAAGLNEVETLRMLAAIYELARYEPWEQRERDNIGAGR